MTEKQQPIMNCNKRKVLETTVAFFIKSHLTDALVEQYAAFRMANNNLAQLFQYREPRALFRDSLKQTKGSNFSTRNKVDVQRVLNGGGFITYNVSSEAIS
jgi:hypothetical protein